jgi:DNA-binding GntR family transcriptional regulator
VAIRGPLTPVSLPLYVLEMLNEHIVQVWVVTSPARFRHAVDGHLAIIAALKARDAQESMETMRRHLESARESLVLLS